MSPANTRASALAFGLLLALAAASGAALAQSKPSLAAAARAAPSSEPQAANALEAVGAGDMVRVTVFRNPDLTTEARVTDQGTIFFPLIGEVPVAGLTPQQASKRIAAGSPAAVRGHPEVQLSIATVKAARSRCSATSPTRRYPSTRSTARERLRRARAGWPPPAPTTSPCQVRNARNQDRRRPRANVRNGNSANLDSRPATRLRAPRADDLRLREVNKAGPIASTPHDRDAATRRRRHHHARHRARREIHRREGIRREKLPWPTDEVRVDTSST